MVSRSGANIVYELLALGKPCLLIPMPWVSHNEQYLNAKILEDVGLGRILPESELTSQRLEELVDDMLAALPKFIAAAKEAQKLVVYDAAQRVVQEINAILVEG